MARKTTKPKTEKEKSATDVTADAKAQAKSTAKQVKEQAGSTATDVKETVKDAANQAMNQAASTLDDAKSQAYIAAEEQKDRTTDRLNGVVGALRQSSGQFRSQDDQTFAQYTDAAADQVEKFASYLDTRDMGELMSNVQDFARRQPEMFIAGALTAGFFLGRFLKSSQSSDHARTMNGPRQNRDGWARNSIDEYERSFSGGATAFNAERSATNPNMPGNKADWGVDRGSVDFEGSI